MARTSGVAERAASVYLGTGRFSSGAGERSGAAAGPGAGGSALDHRPRTPPRNSIRPVSARPGQSARPQTPSVGGGTRGRAQVYSAPSVRGGGGASSSGHQAGSEAAAARAGGSGGGGGGGGVEAGAASSGRVAFEAPGGGGSARPSSRGGEGIGSGGTGASAASGAVTGRRGGGGGRVASGEGRGHRGSHGVVRLGGPAAYAAWAPSVTGRGSGSGASGAGASGAADGGVAGVQGGSRATSAGAPAGRSARGAALAGTHHAARGHSAGLEASALRHLQPSGAKEREGGRGGGASGRGSAGRTANSAGTGRVSRPSSRPATPTGTTQWASSREAFVRLHSSSGTRGTEEHAGSRGSSDVVVVKTQIRNRENIQGQI